MVISEELLETTDFSATVNNIARDFREKFALPAVHQLGLVVPDVEEAASRLEKQGIGPFFIAAGSPEFWRERGEERLIRGKLGMAGYRGLELELLEPVEGSDFYSQSLDPAGRVAVQHLGLLVRDVDAWAERLARAGWPVWIRGRLRMGPLKVDFAYMDTVEAAGVVIELICWRMLGWRFKPPAGLLKAAGWAEKCSGRRSVSV